MHNKKLLVLMALSLLLIVVLFFANFMKVKQLSVFGNNSLNQEEGVLRMSNDDLLSYIKRMSDLPVAKKKENVILALREWNDICKISKDFNPEFYEDTSLLDIVLRDSGLEGDGEWLSFNIDNAYIIENNRYANCNTYKMFEQDSSNWITQGVGDRMWASLEWFYSKKLNVYCVWSTSSNLSEIEMCKDDVDDRPQEDCNSIEEKSISKIVCGFVVLK